MNCLYCHIVSYHIISYRFISIHIIILSYKIIVIISYQIALIKCVCHFEYIINICMILGVRIYRRNVCILYRSLECMYKGMVIHEYMIRCPQYCAPVLSSVINMEGAELFCACHGRGDIAGCIGGLGSIRFTCPFTFRCDFHRRCFSPKITWDDLG